MNPHPCRTSLLAAMAALVTMLGACGGGGGGGRPDTSQVEKKLLDGVNIEVDGKARFVEFKERTRKSEGEGAFESCEVLFDGEIEFTGACTYHMKERKKGERLKFEASVEFLKDASGWQQKTMGIYPR